MNRFLYRQGAKASLANDIIKYFPDFNCLVSPFFGSGSIEFNYIGKIKYLIANDLDDNVYNLYIQVRDNAEELIDYIEMIPVHPCILSPQKGINLIEKAAYFVLACNCSYLAAGHTLKYGRINAKKILLENVKTLHKWLVNNNNTSTQFMNYSYEKVFDKIEKRASPFFIYCDPPYCGIRQRYDCPTFTITDFEKLINILIETEQLFAVSEFSNKDVIEIAKQNSLHINYVKNRRNVKSRENEILITNYIPEKIKQQNIFG